MCSVLPFLCELELRVLMFSSSEDRIHFLFPPNLPAAILAATQHALSPANLPPPPAVPSPVKWVSVPAAQSSTDAPILSLHLPSSPEPPKQLVWHRKGDYLASVCTYTASYAFIDLNEFH